MSAPCLQRSSTNNNSSSSEQQNSSPSTLFLFLSPQVQTCNTMDTEYLYEALNSWDWELQPPERESGDALASPPCSLVGGGLLPPPAKGGGGGGGYFWDGCDRVDDDYDEARLFAALGSPLGSEYLATEDEKLFDEYLNKKIPHDVIDLVDQYINSPDFISDQFDVPEIDAVLLDLVSDDVAMMDEDSNGEQEGHQVVPQQQHEIEEVTIVQGSTDESSDDERSLTEMTPPVDDGGSSTARTTTTAATTVDVTLTSNPQVPIIIPSAESLASFAEPDDVQQQQLPATITILVDVNGTVLRINQFENAYLPLATTAPPPAAPETIAGPSQPAPAAEVSISGTSDWRPHVKSDPENVSSPTASPKAKRARTSTTNRKAAKPYERPSTSSNKSASSGWSNNSSSGDESGSSSPSSTSSGDRRRAAAGKPPKERKRSQNRSAANRYREKKRQESEALEGEMEGLAVNNKELKGKVEQLTNEISYLKGLMKDILVAKGLIKK